MATTQKKRELFEASEYIAKMDTMIANLRLKKAGELTGMVGKNEILAARREALQKLLKDGYTTNQIADAMKDDVFGILPKTITEIVSNKERQPSSKKAPVDKSNAKKAADTKQKKEKEQSTKKKDVDVDSGSISVTEDSQDL